MPNSNTYLLVGGLVILIIVVAGAFFVLQEDAPEVTIGRLEQEAVLGNPNATVQIIEYGAYGCTTCRRVRQSGVLEQVLEEHGDEVRFVFRNWPKINPNLDPISAETAQCALDQSDDAFWKIHNAFFDLSISEYEELDQEEDYVQFAEGLGLAGDQIRTCLEEDTHRRTVENWTADADSHNLIGTPVFFVNGQRVSAPIQLPAIVQRELDSQ